MSSDERPDSLAALAASWVPPWEREQRPLDRDFQAAAQDPDVSDELPAPDADVSDEEAQPDPADEVEDLDEPVEVPLPDDDEDRSASSLSDDDDDFDPSFEGANPPGYGEVPPELPPIPGESGGAATVDAPTEVPGETEPDPTDLSGDVDLAMPVPVEDAVADAADDDSGRPVDAPLPPDTDDADAAAFSAGAAEAQPAKPRTVVPPQERKSGGPGVAGGEANGRTAEDLTSDDAGPAADDGSSPIDDTELRAALEAVLLVVDEPVAEMQLAQIMEQPTERIGAMLEDISARYTAVGHGFDLRRAAGGWRLYTRPEYAAYVEKFVLDGQSLRMTQAALETVAVVAYKQPVTRSRISAIRGVNCDGVMRTLVTRGLIEECGTEGETGAYLYRTTPLFLEKLGLNSVDQLPPLAPFLPDDVEEVLDASG